MDYSSQFYMDDFNQTLPTQRWLYTLIIIMITFSKYKENHRKLLKSLLLMKPFIQSMACWKLLHSAAAQPSIQAEPQLYSKSLAHKGYK